MKRTLIIALLTLLSATSALRAQDTIDTTYYRYNFHRPPKVTYEIDGEEPIVFGPLAPPTLIDSVTGQTVTDPETGEPVNLCPNGLGFTGFHIDGVSTWYVDWESNGGEIPLYWVCKMRQPTNTIYGLSIFLDHITDFIVGDTTRFVLAERSHATGRITPFDTIVLKGGEIGIRRQMEVPLMLSSVNESRYSVHNNCIDSVAYAKVMEFYLDTPHQLDGDTLFISPRAPSRFDNGVGSNFKVAYIDAKYLTYNMFVAIREDGWDMEDYDWMAYTPETGMLYATPIIEPLPEWEEELLDTIIPMPTKPDNPDPGDPQDPNDPQNPDNPDDPDNPQDPDNPNNPDNPDNPQDPDDPGTEGIGSQAINSQFSIYPNPTTGLLYIKTAGQPITAITIHNPMGQQVTGHRSQVTGHLTIDLSPLPAGIYYLTIKSNETTTRHKVIKVNQ